MENLYKYLKEVEKKVYYRFGFKIKYSKWRNCITKVYR